MDWFSIKFSIAGIAVILWIGDKLPAWMPPWIINYLLPCLVVAVPVTAFINNIIRIVQAIRKPKDKS